MSDLFLQYATTITMMLKTIMTTITIILIIKAMSLWEAENLSSFADLRNKPEALQVGSQREMTNRVTCLGRSCNYTSSNLTSHHYRSELFRSCLVRPKTLVHAGPVTLGKLGQNVRCKSTCILQALQQMNNMRISGFLSSEQQGFQER